MLRKIIRMSDPVVTSGGGLIRFEGFSGCCSAYARLDMNSGSYDGVVVAQGTTNVDFNADMRAALRHNQRRSLWLNCSLIPYLCTQGTARILRRRSLTQRCPYSNLVPVALPQWLAIMFPLGAMIWIVE